MAAEWLGIEVGRIILGLKIVKIVRLTDLGHSSVPMAFVSPIWDLRQRLAFHITARPMFLL